MVSKTIDVLFPTNGIMIPVKIYILYIIVRCLSTVMFFFIFSGVI